MKPENLQEADELSSLSKTEKEILKDFYLSFRFSQGDEATQVFILAYIVNNYSEEKRRFFFECQNRLETRVGLFRLPPNHAGGYVDEVGRLRTLANLWRIFSGLMRAYYSNQGQSLDKFIFEADVKLLSFPYDEAKIIGKITEKMAERDAKYLYKSPTPIFSRYDNKQSYLRDYAILGRETGSAILDTMFEKVRTVLFNFRESPSSTEMSSELKKALEHLNDRWRGHFPYDVFATWR